MMVQYPDGMNGQVRTCQGHELDLLTSQGWRLVFSYQETTHIPCNETELSTHPQHYNGTVQVQRFKPNVSTFFVLHKMENLVIDDLNERLTRTNGELADARGQKETALKELAETKKKHDDLKRTSEFDAATHKNVVEEKNRFRTSATKLEGDLAKIRKAIGERQFNEILPPEPPKS